MLAHHLSLYCWGSIIGSRGIVCYGGMGVLLSSAVMMIVELLSYLHSSLRCTTPLDTCGSAATLGIVVYSAVLSRLWCAVLILEHSTKASSTLASSITLRVYTTEHMQDTCAITMIQDGVVPAAGLLLLDWYTCSGVCMKSRELAGFFFFFFVPAAGLLLLDWYTCSGVCMIF
nr:NADH dehydrogenase subunit 9 [Rhynchopus humris]